jgi:hypothetical protein
MAWHIAACLQVLLGQLNRYAPNRSKVSDGALGDAAHASRNSDHNPWYKNTVTARDFTHDPKGGLDCNQLADSLVASKDRRIKYIIWDRRIWQNGWQAYRGPNPHTKHLHLSVVASPACEDTTLWALPEMTHGPLEDDVLREEDIDKIADRVWEKVRKNGFGDTVAPIQILNGVEVRVCDLQKEVDEKGKA